MENLTMARPEITGRKKRKRRPLPPRRPGDSFTIVEFCASNRISESFYHKLKSLGLGPREAHAGRRVIITPDANAEWQTAREREAAGETSTTI
jgi:hypothetical protein